MHNFQLHTLSHKHTSTHIHTQSQTHLYGGLSHGHPVWVELVEEPINQQLLQPRKYHVVSLKQSTISHQQLLVLILKQCTSQPAWTPRDHQWASNVGRTCWRAHQPKASRTAWIQHNQLKPKKNYYPTNSVSSRVNTTRLEDQPKTINY